jgi:hypothetical protein
MELRSSNHLLGVALFGLGVILPILLGLLFESIVKGKLFGRLGDAGVALVAGCVPAFIVYKSTHYVVTDYSQNLATIERIADTYMLRDGAIFLGVSLISAFIVLFVLRAVLGRRQASS